MNKPDQDNDLEWQKEAETDSLNKSAKPDRTYMDEYNLCKLCHGKRQVCERTDCPQRL
jgi:hypothetical protein